MLTSVLVSDSVLELLVQGMGLPSVLRITGLGERATGVGRPTARRDRDRL